MIKPTVGRVVLFKRPNGRPGDELAAMVCRVWSDHMVNLVVFDANGHPMSYTSVLLLQDDAGPAGASYWCEWMPYQKGQAAKTDAAEAKADAAALDVSALAQTDHVYGAAAGGGKSDFRRLPAGTPLTDGFGLTGRAEPIGGVCLHRASVADHEFGVMRCTTCGQSTRLIGGAATAKGAAGS